MDVYNNQRTHQGKRCQGRTPMETFQDGIRLFQEKNLTEMAGSLNLQNNPGVSGHCQLKFCSGQISTSKEKHPQKLGVLFVVSIEKIYNFLTCFDYFRCDEDHQFAFVYICSF